MGWWWWAEEEVERRGGGRRVWEEDVKNMIIKSTPKQDGDPTLRSHGKTCRGIQHIRHRQLSGSSTTIGSRTKVGILGDPHPGLNSSDLLVQRCFFRLLESDFPGNRRGCRQVHLPHATFSHVQSLRRSHNTDDMCTLAHGFLCAEKHSFVHAPSLILGCTRH